MLKITENGVLLTFLMLYIKVPSCLYRTIFLGLPKFPSFKSNLKLGSGAWYLVGPHSGRLVLLRSTMKIWIDNFHFYRNRRLTQYR